MKGLISIVIPVYNSIENLAVCLDSVLAQSYERIEVILVDDGSEDGSTELCKEYEKKDSRIHLIVKENEGVSVARNVGMQMAKGEFLQFVDSDDTLVPTACEAFVNYLKEKSADIVVCGYKRLREHSQRCPVPGFYKDVSEFIPHFSNYYHHKHNTINATWNKIYRKSSIKSKFPEDLSKGEDLLFNLTVLENAKGILFVEDVLYVYNNINENSLAYRYREDGFEIEERLFEQVLQFYNRNISEKKRKCIQFLLDSYLDGIKSNCIALIQQSGKVRKECIYFIKQWIGKPSVRFLLKDKKGFGRKDKIFLYFIQFKWAGMIYYYYRFLYGSRLN